MNSYEKAINMLAESDVVILQKTLEKKKLTMTLKFQKLDFPNIRYTSARNGEVERDMVLDLDSALGVLAIALDHI